MIIMTVTTYLTILLHIFTREPFTGKQIGPYLTDWHYV